MTGKEQARDGRIAVGLVIAVVALTMANRNTIGLTGLAVLCANTILVALAAGFGVSSVRRSSGIDRVLGLAAVVLCTVAIAAVVLLPLWAPVADE